MYGVLRGAKGDGTCLQQAREKTATGNFTEALVVQHMNEGRHERNGKRVDPDVRDADRTPPVVGGRESRSHGEGEQFVLDARLLAQLGVAQAGGEPLVVTQRGFTFEP